MFKNTAVTGFAILRHCVIHRYASSLGHACALLKLRSLLAEEEVERLVDAMISHLIMDLAIDPYRVLDETLDNGAGRGAALAGRDLNVNNALLPHPRTKTNDSLASRLGRIDSPIKRPRRDKCSSGSWCWLEDLNQVLVCMPWIRKSK